MNAIVLGGTNDHITLIEILKIKGYTVYLIDFYQNPAAQEFADYHILGSTLDKEFVLKKCIEIEAKLCLAFCIDQALLTMAYVSERLSLPCHLSFEQASSLTNKVQMKNMFKLNQIPTSNFITLYNNELLDDIKLKYPLVVKPADANSSKGIEKVENKELIDQAIHRAFNVSNSKEVVIEEFIEGLELSVDVIIQDFQAEFILITENIKRTDTPNSFTIVKNRFDITVQEKYEKKVIKIVSQIAKAYNLKNTPLLVQLLVKDEDLYIIEFSARIGGGSKHHFIKELTQFNVIEAYLKILLKERISFDYYTKHSYANMLYIYTKNGVFEDFEGIEKLVQNNYIKSIFQYKIKGTSIDSSNTSTDRPLGVMVVSENDENLSNKNKYIDENLKVLDSQGNDIMIHELFC